MLYKQASETMKTFGKKHWWLSKHFLCRKNWKDTKHTKQRIHENV